MRPEVLAIIKDFQPYSFGDRPGHVNLLSALKSLSNADKHYQLSVIPMGLEDPERTIWLNGTPIVQNSSGMAKDGTVLYRSPFPVRIEIKGTPVVLIRVGGPDRAEIRIAALTDMLLFVRGLLVGTLSPYLEAIARTRTAGRQHLGGSLDRGTPGGRHPRTLGGRGSGLAQAALSVR